MALNYRYHPDERPNSLLVDDTESWWSGVQHGFVRVPIALTLAATALSVSLAFGYQQQTDEIPSQPLTIVDDESWQRPICVASLGVHLWAVDDDLPVAPAATLNVDEDYWWTPYSLPATLCAPLFMADDEMGAFVAPPPAEYALDGSVWMVQVLPPAKRSVIVF